MASKLRWFERGGNKTRLFCAAALVVAFFIFFPTSMARATVEESNVFAYWPLDYGAGAADYRHCTMTGIFASTSDCLLSLGGAEGTDVQGKFGGMSDARYYSGSTGPRLYDYPFADAFMPATTGEFSIGWWQKTSYDYGTSKEDVLFTYNGWAGVPYDGEIRIWGTKHNGGHTKLNLQYRRSSTDWANLETLNDFNFVFPDDGQYHNYIITGKFGTGFTIYEDGVILDTQWWRGNAGNTFSHGTSNNIFDFWGRTTSPEDTTVDDVWVAYKELSAEEVNTLQSAPFSSLFLPSSGCHLGCQVSFNTLEKGFNGDNMPDKQGYCFSPGWKNVLPPFAFQSLGPIYEGQETNASTRVIKWTIGTSTCPVSSFTGMWIPSNTGGDSIMYYLASSTPLGIQPICWELTVIPYGGLSQYYYATSSIEILDGETATSCIDVFSPYNEKNLPWCESISSDCEGLANSFKCAGQDMLCWIFKPSQGSADYALAQLTRASTHFPLNTYTTLFRDLTLMATGTQYQAPGTVVMPDYNLASHIANRWGLGSTTFDFSTDTPETADLKKLFYPKEKYVFYVLAACACSLLVIKFL
jgi:hypothetical protein